jgi:nascent polypeptide-associated complex subunit alpha
MLLDTWLSLWELWWRHGDGWIDDSLSKIIFADDRV